MWYTAESGIKPLEIDTSSSKKFVYLRRNITEEQREEELIYTYEEQKITKQEYALYLSEKNQADIEYLSMMM